MTDQAVMFLASRFAIAWVEFLIVGFLVAILLAASPNVSPRWRRWIWFFALCKPLCTFLTGSINGLIPLGPLVNGRFIGDFLFPSRYGSSPLIEGGPVSIAVHAGVYLWLAGIAVGLVLVWLRSVAIRQTLEDHLAKGYLLKPTTIRQLDPDLKVPPSARIIVTPEDAGPATMGVFKPAIVIPEALLPWVIHHRDPTAQERMRFCQVLRHELAHLTHRDDLLTLGILILRCFFWPHPLTYWAYSRVRLNNELCCDEQVVSSGVKPAEYVDTLMSIVAGRFSRRGFAMHILGDSGPAGMLRKRLHHVLRARVLGNRKPVRACVVLGVVLLTMPRFLGMGPLVEVRMHTGETRLVTRAELEELGPQLVDQVLTPGVVDESWWSAPTYADGAFADERYAAAAAGDGQPGAAVQPAPDAGALASADGTGAAKPPESDDAVLLADADDTTPVGETDAGKSAGGKRSGRGPGWSGEGGSVGPREPTGPILPPPANR